MEIFSHNTLYTYIRHSPTQWELIHATALHTTSYIENAFQDVINKPTQLLDFEVFNTRILRDPKTMKIVPKIGSNGRKQ